MPNGDGSNLKFMGIFNLGRDHKQWHIEVARHLRFFAARIETNGLDGIDGERGRYFVGKIISGSLEQGGHTRGIFEYNQR